MSILTRSGKELLRNMKVYKVEIDASAREDIEDLSDFLATKMSLEGARRYLDTMIQEVLSLSVYADFYTTSRSKTINMIHPKARRMVSHNKKWNYIFHVENDIVVVDRVMASKMIVK